MYHKFKVVALVTVLIAFALPASALEDVVQSVATGCEKELSTICKDVTPGQGRVLACLYAHSVKYPVVVNMLSMMLLLSLNVQLVR